MESVGFKNFTHKDLLDITLIGQLKKEIMFFDKIMIPAELFEKTKDFLYENKKFLSEELVNQLSKNLNEIDLLEKYGVLSKYNHTEKFNNILKVSGEESQEINKMAHQVIFVGQEIIREAGKASSDDFLNSRVQYGDLVSRMSALLHRNIEFIDAIPLIHNFQTNHLKINTEKIDVAQVVLNKFPEPTANTDWEKIINFKNDKGVDRSLTELKAWMEETSISGKDKNAIKLELELLINRYQEYMNIHKIEYGLGSFRSVIKISADILGNLVKIKWGDVAASLFDIFGHNIDLMKAEMEAPGRQIAFLSKAENYFQG